jgi:hypothetical protein
MTPPEIILLLFGAVMAIFAFSFIFFEDSYVFGFAENVYIGGIVAYSLFAVQKSLTSSAFIFIAQGRVWLILPLILGFLAFARFTIKDILRGAPDIVSAVFVLIGVAAALTYFLYSATYSKVFYEGRLRPVTCFGRIIPMMSFGYLYGKIFIDENVDTITSFLGTVIKRTVDSLMVR